MLLRFLRKNMMIFLSELILLTSCATIKPNWKDSIKNPKNVGYKSQIDYMSKNYNQLGDSSITWFYKKIDSKL